MIWLNHHSFSIFNSMFDYWRVDIEGYAVRSFGPWGCWSNGACMAFFVSSGFVAPCGSGCWLCATCHSAVATTGSGRPFSLRCLLVSGWRWYYSHMTFSWSFHQTNLAWKGLLEHFHFLQTYFAVYYVWPLEIFLLLICFLRLKGAFFQAALHVGHNASGQHPPIDPGHILVSPPLLFLVSELACA